MSIDNQILHDKKSNIVKSVFLSLFLMFTNFIPHVHAWDLDLFLILFNSFVALNRQSKWTVLGNVPVCCGCNDLCFSLTIYFCMHDMQ